VGATPVPSAEASGPAPQAAPQARPALPVPGEERVPAWAAALATALVVGTGSGAVLAARRR
jgi:hypothetical protein